MTVAKGSRRFLEARDEAASRRAAKLEIGSTWLAEFRLFDGASGWGQVAVVAPKVLPIEFKEALAALHVPVHADAVRSPIAELLERLGRRGDRAEHVVAYIARAACGSGAVGTGVLEAFVADPTAKLRVGVLSLGRGQAVQVAWHRSGIPTVRRFERGR